jgi:hypothetical protein
MPSPKAATAKVMPENLRMVFIVAPKINAQMKERFNE